MANDVTSGNEAFSDMENIQKAFDIAKEYELQWEVLCWAMYALRTNPKLSIGQAMSEGLEEWIR